jgi:hypothetical protein
MRRGCVARGNFSSFASDGGIVDIELALQMCSVIRAPEFLRCRKRMCHLISPIQLGIMNAEF